MVQNEETTDYVIASGETHSVEECLANAFGFVGLDWHDYVVQDPQYMRPAEVDLLVGDATKARNELGWESKVSFKELIQMMVESDLKMIRDGRTPM